MISVAHGFPIDIEDKIGDYFEANSVEEVDWDIPSEEEDDEGPGEGYSNSIKLSYILENEARQMIISKKHTMRSFMQGNWEEIEWAEFRHEGRKIDPDLPLLSIADKDLRVSVEILTQEEVETQDDYEEVQEEQDEDVDQEEDQEEYESNQEEEEESYPEEKEKEGEPDGTVDATVEYDGGETPIEASRGSSPGEPETEEKEKDQQGERTRVECKSGGNSDTKFLSQETISPYSPDVRKIELRVAIGSSGHVEPTTERDLCGERARTTPGKTERLLKLVLEEIDPWTMGPKEMKVWEKILSKEDSQWARSCQDRLTKLRTYISELSDQVTEDLTPDEPKWKKLWRRR
jgi:hypothetical protein